MVNSFTVFAVGVLARNPEVFIDQGETAARFCLVGNDFEEIDGAVREFVTSVWFFASDPVATALRKRKKGDQLIVEARVIASNVVVERGGTDYDYAFDVISFRYGAKKGGGGEPAASRNPPNQPPVEGGAEIMMEVAAA
jgi:single-stranded DNA-binding protein